MGSERQDRYIESFQKMIRIDTVSDPENGSPPENFESFRSLLWELFPHIKEACEVRDFNGSLLMKWKGKDGSADPVMFMNHYDVVPASGDWKYPPFSGEIAEGKIWGRGTLDDKGGVFAMLQAADELASEGFTPERTVYFETACNEETLGQGADEISSWMKDQGIRLEMVFDEGGDILYEPIGGVKAAFAMIGVGEKSIVNLKFIARSDGGHASTPGKDTPLARLAGFITYVEKRRIFDVELAPATVEMLKRFAPYMGKAGKIIENADRMKKPLAGLLTVLSPTAKALVTTTIAFTMTGGGEAPNVIPREAWVLGDMRCSHHQGMADSINRITKTAEKFGLDVEITEQCIESGITDYNGRAFRLAEEAVKATVPGVDACAPFIMTGGSDSKYFGRVCDQCIRFLPFFITEEQMDSIHGVNECLNIGTIVPAVDYYRYMLTHV